MIFPLKMYNILENEDEDIVRWDKDGFAFRILNPHRFELEIVPKYFRHSKFSSVQRQLNLYGFKCISRGEDKGVYFHANFRRGGLRAAEAIERVPSMKQDIPQDPTNKSRVLDPASDEPYPPPQSYVHRSRGQSEAQERPFPVCSSPDLNTSPNIVVTKVEGTCSSRLHSSTASNERREKKRAPAKPEGSIHNLGLYARTPTFRGYHVPNETGHLSNHEPSLSHPNVLNRSDRHFFQPQQFQHVRHFPEVSQLQKIGTQHFRSELHQDQHHASSGIYPVTTNISNAVFTGKRSPPFFPQTNSLSCGSRAAGSSLSSPLPSHLQQCQPLASSVSITASHDIVERTPFHPTAHLIPQRISHAAAPRGSQTTTSSHITPSVHSLSISSNPSACTSVAKPPLAMQEGQQLSDFCKPQPNYKRLLNAKPLPTSFSDRALFKDTDTADKMSNREVQAGCNQIPGVDPIETESQRQNQATANAIFLVGKSSMVAGSEAFVLEEDGLALACVSLDPYADLFDALLEDESNISLSAPPLNSVSSAPAAAAVLPSVMPKQRSELILSSSPSATGIRPPKIDACTNTTLSQQHDREILVRICSSLQL